MKRRVVTVLGALTLLAGLLVSTAPPAAAVEVIQRTGTLSAWPGQTAYYKIALEKDLSFNTGRSHLAVWCSPSPCGGVDLRYADDLGESQSQHALQYWNEGHLAWEVGSPGNSVVPGGGIDLSPPATLNKYTPWDCTLQGVDQYRALFRGVQVQNISGDWGTTKTVVTPTWDGPSASFC